MSETLEKFKQYLDKMKKYEHVNTLLYWDMKTGVPKLGQAGHVDALTYFSTESFAMATSSELSGMLKTLSQPEEFSEAALIAQIMIRFRLGVPDVWIAHRVDEMIRTGRLAVVSQAPEGHPAYKRILRKIRSGR